MTQDDGSLEQGRRGGACLFVRPKEPGDFGAQQLDEGAREHLFGLLCCVPEVVLRMGQHIKQGLY